MSCVSLPSKILITGVSGFIGHSLTCKLVKSGIKVAAIVRPGSSLARIPVGVEVHEHDGSTAGMIRIFEEVRPELVFHLASCFLARHRAEDIDTLVDSNLRFGLQILEAMAATGSKRLVNTGTGWQHYCNSHYDPVCLYAATKQAFEALIEYYVRVHSLQALTLKLHDTYGDNDPRGKLIDLLINAARSGQPIDLSPGEQRIDLVHVNDVVEAFRCAEQYLSSNQKPGHEIFMVSSGAPITIRELVTYIDNFTGKPIHANWGMRPYREREVMVPWDKGDAVPGWYPVIGLKEGIHELWRAGLSEQ